MRQYIIWCHLQCDIQEKDGVTRTPKVTWILYPCDAEMFCENIKYSCICFSISRSISNHWQINCLLKTCSGLTSQTSKLHITGLLCEESNMDQWTPLTIASSTESIWMQWHHHCILCHLRRLWLNVTSCPLILTQYCYVPMKELRGRRPYQWSPMITHFSHQTWQKLSVGDMINIDHHKYSISCATDVCGQVWCLKHSIPHEMCEQRVCNVF